MLLRRRTKIIVIGILFAYFAKVYLHKRFATRWYAVDIETPVGCFRPQSVFLHSLMTTLIFIGKHLFGLARGHDFTFIHPRYIFQKEMDVELRKVSTDGERSFALTEWSQSPH